MDGEISKSCQFNIVIFVSPTGESILLCRETEKTKVEQLIESDLEPVSSCLIQGNGETLCSSMKRAILEVGSSNKIKKISDLETSVVLSSRFFFRFPFVLQEEWRKILKAMT